MALKICLGLNFLISESLIHRVLQSLLHRVTESRVSQFLSLKVSECESLSLWLSGSPRQWVSEFWSLICVFYTHWAQKSFQSTTKVPSFGFKSVRCEAGRNVRCEVWGAGLDKIKTFRDRSGNFSKLSVKVRKLRQQNLQQKVQNIWNQESEIKYIFLFCYSYHRKNHTDG